MDVIYLDLGMSVAQCRQTEASVRSRIFSIADAKEGQLQQPQDGGEHAFARETVTTQIRVDPGSDQGQKPWRTSAFCRISTRPGLPAIVDGSDTACAPFDPVPSPGHVQAGRG